MIYKIVDVNMLMSAWKVIGVLRNVIKGLAVVISSGLG